MQHLGMALEIYHDLGNRIGYAQCLQNIGNLHILRVEYDRAAENYYRSLNTYKELGNKRGIGETHAQLGVLNASQENYKEAVTHLLISASVLRELESPSLASVISNLSFIHKNIGDTLFNKYVLEFGDIVIDI